MNDFNENPYEHLAPQFKKLDQLRKDTDATILKFQNEFLEVFRPDKTQFDDLMEQARQAKINHLPQAEIEKIYDKMAIIYTRWLPIEESLLEGLPSYKVIFNYLKTKIKPEKKKSKKRKDS